MVQEDTELLGGGEGVITFPLPCGEPKKIPVKEALLFDRIKMYHSAKKRNKQLGWTNLRLTPIKFESKNQLKI